MGSVIESRVQEGIKQALKAHDTLRLETLRMAKAALLLKEKSGPHPDGLSDEEAVAALRSEIKQRQQSIETYREVNRPDVVAQLEEEIRILEEFLPKQLSPEELEAKVRQFLAAHPEFNHAGKLTGALKKELGDTADGRLLNEICRKVLEEGRG